jgi:hypothetical protein
MKPARFGLFLLRLLPLFALAVVSPGQAGENARDSVPAATVSYDKANDHLHVSVEAVPLKFVLGRIAQQSGIEVMFDDMADGPVTIDIKSSTLADGLKRILKGQNHMLRYSRDEQEKLLLIGVMVLPAGEQDTGRARPLVAIDDEAFYRARSQLSVEQAQQMDMSIERWQARMSEMPPDVRQRMEKSTAARLQQQLENDRWRAERRKKQLQKESERKARRLQQHELVLKGMDPEQRAAFEQDREAAREEMRVLLEKK